MLLALLLLQTGQSSPISERPPCLCLSVCLRSPSPQRICLVPHFAL